MTFEVEVKVKCINCDDVFNFDDIAFSCDDCIETQENNNVLICIKKCLEYDYLWKDKDRCYGFDSESEKDIFLNGVKLGYLDALFWVADYFGIGDEWEKLDV